MDFGEANFLDAPHHAPHDAPLDEPAPARAELHDRFASKLPPATDQTSEMSIDDLGLNLDHNLGSLEETDHPSDAPTMVAGLDDKSRHMMAEAERNARDRDLTELERELEASFVADLESSRDEIKTAVLGPESAPTVHMPRSIDPVETSRFAAVSDSDPRVHLEAARTQRRQHRLGSGPSGLRAGQRHRRYRGTDREPRKTSSPTKCSKRVNATSWSISMSGEAMMAPTRRPTSCKPRPIKLKPVIWQFRNSSR